MLVRPVEKRDNQDLIELARRTPMEGMITVYIDRSPDYLAFYNLHGIHALTIEDEQERLSGKHDMWQSMVAEQDGTVIGVLTTAIKTVLFDGKPIRMAYLLDAHAHIDHRRKGVVRTIGFTFAEKHGHVKADCALGYIMQGNRKAVEGITKGGTKIFTGRSGGVFSMYQLSMYRPYWTRGPVMERATENDKAEIVSLLAEFYAGYNFAPVFDEERFDRMMSVSRGYSYNDIRVVREGGRIVALLGLWDQSPIRNVVVVKNTGVVKLGLAVARFLRMFMTAPKPPEEGKPLRSLYVKHIACCPGYEKLLRSMLKRVTDETRRSCKYHFIWGVYFQTDPLRRLFRGLTKTEIKSELFYGPWNTGWDADPEQVKSTPAYADFSLV